MTAHSDAHSKFLNALPAKIHKTAVEKPSSTFLGKLAAFSPELAFLAVKHGVTPQFLSARFVFDDASQEPQKFTIPVQQNVLVVEDIVYDVQRPNYFPEDIGKAQADLANSKLPGILVKIEAAQGFWCRDYTLNCPNPSPIQHIFRQSTSYSPTSFLCNWRIAFPDEFILTCNLDRVLQTDQPRNEVPYILDVTFRGWTIPCGVSLDSGIMIDSRELEEIMTKLGLPTACCG